MKRVICVSLAAVLTVMLLLYIQVHCFVPEQKRENEMLRDCGDDMNKGGNNNLEDPKADSLPDLPAESAGGCRSSMLSEEEREVLLAYAQYFQKYCEDYPFETEGIKYDLVFIDNDSIPELAIVPSAAHASSVILCTYKCGEVVEMGGFGSFGKCRFNPYENLIFSTYMGQGEEESSFYRIEETECVELLVLHSAPQYLEGRYIGDYCEVNGIRVAEEEYRQVCEEWDWEKLNVWGYEDAMLVNDGGDPYIELCQRLSYITGMLK